MTNHLTDILRLSIKSTHPPKHPTQKTICVAKATFGTKIPPNHRAKSYLLS